MFIISIYEHEISISLCLQFLSLMSYSFLCIDLSSWWLMFILRYFIVFDATIFKNFSDSSLLFSFLTALLRNSVLCWEGVVRVGTLTLLLILRGKAFSRSLLNIVAWGGGGRLSYGAFIVLRCVPSTCFVESFCHERVLNFVKCFFCIFWDIHIFYFFILLSGYFIYYLVYACWALCIPGVTPLDGGVLPFTVPLGRVCWCCAEGHARQAHWPVVSFPVVSLLSG